MTADELRASVARSRAAQGLPPQVADTVALRAVLTVLRPDLPPVDVEPATVRAA